MSLKYRIKYDTYSRYEKGSIIRKFAHVLLSFILCVALLLLAYFPQSAKLLKVILPGDPVATTDAFRQFSMSIDRGDPLVEALDAFCSTVMNVQ